MYSVDLVLKVGLNLIAKTFVQKCFFFFFKQKVCKMHFLKHECSKLKANFKSSAQCKNTSSPLVASFANHLPLKLIRIVKLTAESKSGLYFDLCWTSWYASQKMISLFHMNKLSDWVMQHEFQTVLPMHLNNLQIIVC